MTQKTQEYVCVPRVDHRALTRWLLADGSDYKEISDLLRDERQETDLAEAKMEINNRPKSKKWILLR